MSSNAVAKIKQELGNNAEYKIKADKFLKEYFGFKERISEKMTTDIKIFDNTLSAEGIIMTLSRKERGSLLDFKDGKNFSQVTFVYKNVNDENVTKNITTKKTDGTSTVENKNAFTIEANGQSTYGLRPYQQKAMTQLSDAFKAKENRNRSLLVIPTGGGKTFIATYWMLKTQVSKGVKILWLAHRHSLLDQAAETIEKACTEDVLPRGHKLSVQIVSGFHDNPVSIKQETDIVIGGKDSFQNKGLKYLLENWVKYQKEILIVVDEAHHATARTYRTIIDKIFDNKNLKANLLGLTATPIRTAEKEQGLIKKMFPDAIADGNTDLKKLINDGYLAKPNFNIVKTEFKIELSEKQIAQINKSDLPDDLAAEIALNTERNNKIYKHYEIEKHGKTIVFAVNVAHAIQLKGLFEQVVGKDKVAFIISGGRAAFTNASVSREDNQKALDEFKKGNIQILINVNILTEGVDVPDVNSIFLTRPTTSTIMMTQMIGRGLRRTNNKNECKIVCFIDDFEDKICWENPEKAFIETDIDFIDNENNKLNERITRLIAISKIEEFTKLCDGEIDEELACYGFIEHIPVGFYGFYLDETRYDIMVYEHLKDAYQMFVNDLPNMLEIKHIEENNVEEVITYLVGKLVSNYFENKERFGFKEIDIQRVIQYYIEAGELPKFHNFEDREQYNLDKIVKNAWDNGENNPINLEEKIWDKKWELMFGEGDIGKMRFGHYVYHLMSKIRFENKENNERPKITYAKKSAEDCRSVYEMKQLFPKEGKELEECVWAASKYKNVPKSERCNYQIDHIKEWNEGGKTVFDNLQILKKEEHSVKTQRKNTENRNS